ncbi:Hsp20/alpha crystallin family protein [Mariniflexile sp.]|uniref:Hsp20/alpha crystallin family protein n=1 Tax=Mariniflexile sp. TaxID=1979402 RepID=UPI003569A170
MFPRINNNRIANSTAKLNKSRNYNYRNDSNSSDVRLTETEDGYHLELDIVGYVKDDFNYYVTKNNALVLTTDRSSVPDANKKTEGSTTKHKYCYASAFFKKIFRLPYNVSKNNIIVDYKNHILSIDLFKLKPA